MGSTMSTLRIHLFGKFSVQRLELLLDGFDAHKPQELLCYSSLLRTLAIISWSEIITAQSKKNLPHTLLHLQSERYTPLEELDISPSKSPFQLVSEMNFPAFLTPNGEWNDRIP